MSLKKLFTEDVQKILTEESLIAIQEAFDAKVNLNVETALIEQDEIYASKLQNLVTALDKDRSKKLKRVVEAVDKNNGAKLLNVVKKYERLGNKDAKNFKRQVVESVSVFLDEFLAESIEEKDIKHAVKNTTAYNVLENLRKALAVDTVMMKESVRNGILDGKSKLDKLEKENQDLKKGFKALYEENQKTEVAMILENKTSKLPEAKKQFLRKALGDKSLKFIEENFDYTSRLFDKQEKVKLASLKEEAILQRPVKPDVAPYQKIVTEKVNTSEHADMYVQELSRSWSAKK